MNTYLQIGLGLLPSVIIILVLLIRRKVFQLKSVLLAVVVTVCCSALLFTGIRQMIKNGLFEGRLSQNEMIAFANALFLEGAYDEARELLDEYSAVYGYDDHCRLLSARISLMEGDYLRADGLYGYLCSHTGMIDEEDREVEFASTKGNYNAAELVMMDYLNSIGADLEEYGYSEVHYRQLKTETQVDEDSVVRAIRRSIEDVYSIDDDMEDCAKAVYAVMHTYSSTPDDGEKKNSFGSRRTYEDWEDFRAEFMQLGCVRKARLKAYVLAGDFDRIVEELGPDSTYHELMVAAELYMSGLVRTEDFSDAYQVLGRSDLSAVKNQVDKVRKKQKDLSNQERRMLRERTDAITMLLEEPTLITVKEQLAEAALEEAGTDRTKVYLEIAKIENYFGNETSTDNYLREAIYNSQDCKDDSYATAMGQIMSVISNDGTDDLEDIKNVTMYVDTVLDHSLTVDVEAIVSPQYQSASDDLDEEEEEGQPDFARTAVDYVSRAMSAVSIGAIDTAEFDKITVRVQISSDHITDIDKLKDALEIYDCGVQIQDFTLKKLEFDSARILLCCDVSGSMQESMQDLQNAVTTFINERNEDEKLSIVTFSGGIEGTAPFGASDRELLAFTESMRAFGGTNIFYTVLDCLDDFSNQEGVNNVLIVMTDGQDGSKRGDAEIRAQIGGLADQNAVTVYTLGLGSSVETAYLNTIAASGNGEFVYVSDSASLTAFFNMLHGQLDSQYEITYTAEDTLTMSGRTLEVVLPSENVRDVKRYALRDAEDSDGSGIEVSEGVIISAMSPRYIYKGRQDVTVQLKGAGFTADSAVTVKLNGNIDYTLDAVYVDGETYRLTVPAGVAVDTYQVEVAINGRRKVLPNGFAVIEQGSEKKTAFGPYVFTSAQKIENADGSLILRGAVEMNGWLRFKGDLVISGDLEEGGSVTVTDNSGSYVEFDPAAAEGFGKTLADRGVSLDIPALYSFHLYNDLQHLYEESDYLVEDISTGPLALFQLVSFDSPTMRLYPSSIGMYYKAGNIVLPWQKQIFQKNFTFKMDGSSQITGKNVGIVFNMEYEDPKNEYREPMNLFNAPVRTNASAKMKIDTLKNEYMVGAKINFDFLDEKSGVAAEIEWKGVSLEAVKIGLDLADPVTLPTTIPLEMNEFSVAVSNLQEAVQQRSLLNVKITGSATITSGNPEAYFPKLANFVEAIDEDWSILAMPDTTVSLQLSPLQIEAEAKLVFLEEITLAEAEVKLGNFEYTNSMLGLNKAQVKGLYASLKTGLMWETAGGRVSVEISGKGELDAHSRFVGVNYTGTVAYDIGWWIIHSEGRKEGTALLGLYTTHSGMKELVFACKYQDSRGKVGGIFVYIDENGKAGIDNGRLI